MKRVMCVHLPLWPLQRLRHDRPALRDKFVALCDGGSNSPRIVMCSVRERGRSCGLNRSAVIRPGMPVAEALAIDPQLHVEPYDAERDMAALGRLAEWAGRFSPIVALETAERRYSLLLDITGCAACFGGEDKILERAACGLLEQGWNGRVAMADTPGAAWGLAHYGDTPCRVPPGETEAALRPLPVAALRLPDETVGYLAELGIERIGELIALPRSSLPARWGPKLLERLDQAMGRLPEMLVPYRPLPPVEASYSFEYATDQRDIIDSALNQLIQQVCRLLEQRSAGARQVECLLHHESARPTRLEIELVRASRSVRHFGMLFSARFERVTIAEPVCVLRLRVPVTVPLDASQREIFDSDMVRDDGELARLVDELSNRLGCESVARGELVPDAQPEYACRYEPAIHEKKRQRSSRELLHVPTERPALRVPGSFYLRPVRLWSDPIWIPAVSLAPEGPPLRFHWAGAEHSIAHSWGPERIETGWWRGQDVQRDYYLVETESGSRFWIYRRRDDGQWFLHGCFD